MPKNKAKTVGKRVGSRNRSKRSAKLFRSGLLTSGKTYFLRLDPGCFVPRKVSDNEFKQFQKPHSFVRSRLAVILTQNRRRVDIRHLVVTKETRIEKEKVRCCVLEYGY